LETLSWAIVGLRFIYLVIEVVSLSSFASRRVMELLLKNVATALLSPHSLRSARDLCADLEPPVLSDAPVTIDRPAFASLGLESYPCYEAVCHLAGAYSEVKGRAVELRVPGLNPSNDGNARKDPLEQNELTGSVEVGELEAAALSNEFLDFC
jgi:hypothetical protein